MVQSHHKWRSFVLDGSNFNNLKFFRCQKPGVQRSRNMTMSILGAEISGHGGDGGKSYTDTILCIDTRAFSSDMGLELVREVSFSQHQSWKTASCNVAILLREGVRTITVQYCVMNMTMTVKHLTIIIPIIHYSHISWQPLSSQPVFICFTVTIFSASFMRMRWCL